MKEYLWELGIEQAERAQHAAAQLERLVRGTTELCSIEDLDERALLRVLFETESSGAAPGEFGTEELEEIRGFARWIEEHHDHGLWTLFETTHAELIQSAGRLQLGRSALAQSTRETTEPRGEWHELVELLADGRFGVLDEAGDFCETELPDGVREHLSGGDWVLVHRRPGALWISGLRPAAFGRLRN